MRNIRRASLGILLLLAFFACKPREDTTTTATTDTTSTASYTAATDTTSTTALPQDEFKLDHYKFWKVKPYRAKGEEVYLQGQFDRVEWPANLVSIQYLANPTDKSDVSGQALARIKNENLHYVVYEIKAVKDQPVRDIQVTNQFAKEEPWQIRQPRLLLVPASKRVILPNIRVTPPDDPPKADHFVCYDASPHELAKVLLLADQFDRLIDPKHVEQIGQLTTQYFCVPVQKRVGKKLPEPVIDRETHLALYKINPPETYTVQAATRDQFGLRTLDATNSELLGVPSRKRWAGPAQ